METQFKFTRYLYEEEEVELSLVVSILDKKEDAAFWAYELFHSGFKEELTMLFWRIYYDFFATTNPAFEKYLLNKLKKRLVDCDDKLVYVLVNRFQLRPYNLDVFLLRNIVKKEKRRELVDSLVAKDYKSIAAIVFQDDDAVRATIVFEEVIDYFVDAGLTLNKEIAVKEFAKMGKLVGYEWMLLSRIFHYFLVLANKMKPEHNLYERVEPSAVTMYETVKPADDLVPRKILPRARRHRIDNGNKLSMFRLKRDVGDIVVAYRMNWLYHASFSPVWADRINEYNGTVNHEEKRVEFEDDDDLEDFHEQYGYEPDEQRLEVQEQSTRAIVENEDAWITFYKTHSKRGVVRMNNNWRPGKINYNAANL